ncbi:hypothetical protein BKA64DRAFT_648391 [Cadophora sp. MPI-SDFR-AT-0126]|nr:hypothetical protein BKA64DRAFT_648391 [Leotiomycetes sp. MPI-SDFR-AT-0126]
MATKLTLCTQVISTLTKQAKKFGTMSVHFAKSADLATSQANEIDVWTSKLIEAVTRIRQEATDAAAASQGHVQDKVRTLKTQSDSAKRKILDTSDLDSPRTVKANFRMIFGPPRETERKSNSAKAVMVTNLIRINTIRGLGESNPDAVIALSTTYSTKVWTESSTDVFDGLIKLLKEEKEQDWPEEIVDIMDELEAERSMSVEFRNLRAKISQRHGRRRRRLGEIDGSAREIVPLPPVQIGELGTQTLYGQYPSGMTQLPSLQEMALIAPSFNRDPTQGRGYRVQTGRQIERMYSNGPISQVSSFGELLSNAIQSSNQWKKERELGESTTNCWTTMIPRDPNQDISITIWLGRKDGHRVNVALMVEPTWSSPSSPRPG